MAALCQNSLLLIVCRFKKPFSVRVHKSITASDNRGGIKEKRKKQTPADMIDRLIPAPAAILVLNQYHYLVWIRPGDVKYGKVNKQKKNLPTLADVFYSKKTN